ncbi:uncharacterized protein VDAG_05801 [Verticillium dahliae VdLs.17]|uniref:Carbonic anhydrase n=1 Tax=Verticillium dahliae (strain VdLs.17 / ATCC MYA-4575 / FGSC 10137) TaxID=498257 RepID=G2X6L9_VERDV|nr:uncharacterized protein VDAG_05801 [Verticillium dahliae VdLs.17]EGY14637.1 hypothetical protein VDAG_05801 [Verticillium dahliae VdLs.17]
MAVRLAHHGRQKARSSEYIEHRQCPPLLQDIISVKGEHGSTCIISCADMRVDPRDFCGLQLGEAKVIRNAGGRTFDAKRSLAVMGTIAPLAMIVVTAAGCAQLMNKSIFGSESEPLPTRTRSNMRFGTFFSIDESLRQDVAESKIGTFWPRTQIVGYAVDIVTGEIHEVVP